MERRSLSVFWPLTILLLIQCHAVVPVTVSTNKPKVEVQENFDATLSCEFFTEQEKNPRIEWKKMGTDLSFVYFNEDFNGAYKGRAAIEGATVTLFKVTQKDAGVYRCEISAAKDSVTLGEANVTLKVLVPPHTPACVIPRSALTGSVVQLVCSDKQSMPPATYTWFKDNKLLTTPHKPNASYLINPTTGILVFKTVTRADTGQYSCQSTNGVGPAKMCEAQLMNIYDMNIAGIVAAVVVICLVIAICGFGGYYTHRNGNFSRHRGSVTVWPTSAARTFTELRTRLIPTTALLLRIQQTLNTPSLLCCEDLDHKKRYTIEAIYRYGMQVGTQYKPII
ncbi:hypothetical protein UPYG_G00025680 [Umbra pygmaea]|uniref:Ig-like domain-containing protein n=1 Tax=Umbra pygmaea TaxID=75934 RepID=A0ABD0XLU6_UMBPY